LNLSNFAQKTRTQFCNFHVAEAINGIASLLKIQ